MSQVPVGRSIAHAYGFLFGRILTVLSLSWVAGLFFAGLRYGLFQAGPIGEPIAEHLGTAAIHLAGLLGALALVSIIALALTREALGDRGKWTLAHFVFGAPELGLFLALVRLYLILIAVIAIAILAVLGVGIGVKAALVQWPVIGKSGVPVELLASIAACAIASLAVLYAGLRLSFFVYPVAAAEEHASLKAAWALGKGNVLRILVVTLAIVIPVYIAVLACEYALMGQSLLDTLQSYVSGKAYDPDALVTLFIAHAGPISIGAAVLMVIMVSLSAGASAAAYRAVKGMDAEAAPVAHDDHGHTAHGAADAHDDHAHGHGGHDEHGAHAPDDHGHGVHEDHGVHAQDEHGHAVHDEDKHEDHADDGHGHDDHGHDDHGHDDHGHDDHGHDDHGHDDHGHAAAEDHAAADHGHEDAGHADHSHADHGHAAPADDQHAHAAATGSEGEAHPAEKLDHAA